MILQIYVYSWIITICFPIFIPLYTGVCSGGGGPMPKFVVKYLLFSFGFGVYGFTWGYRAKTSTIKYKIEKENVVYEFKIGYDAYSGIKNDEKTRAYVNKEIKDKINQVFIIDKVKMAYMNQCFIFIQY